MHPRALTHEPTHLRTRRAGPHTAAELLQACPRLLTVRPQQLGETLDALQACLGAASPRDAAALVAARPPVLMRPPVAVAAAASALVDLVGGDAAAAREMVAAHPGVLLGDGEGFEGGCWGRVLGLGGHGPWTGMRRLRAGRLVCS